MSQASSAVSTKRKILRSLGEMTPSSTSASKFTTRVQNSLPKNNIGIGATFPVWTSVRSSNDSSHVPNPPGKTAPARDRRRKSILRSAKKWHCKLSDGENRQAEGREKKGP